MHIILMFIGGFIGLVVNGFTGMLIGIGTAFVIVFVISLIASLFIRDDPYR